MNLVKKILGVRPLGRPNLHKIHPDYWKRILFLRGNLSEIKNFLFVNTFRAKAPPSN